MNIQEFYSSIGGDYKKALATMRSDANISTYLKMYLDDDAYGRLCAAAENHDVHEAFEAVHVMKGVTGLLCFTPLYNAVIPLVEQLRKQNEPIDEALLAKVQEQQEIVVAAIAKIDK